MTKCLSCGHIRSDAELNCPECGSFYSKITEDDFEATDLLNLDGDINVQKQEKLSLKERFLKLFR